MYGEYRRGSICLNRYHGLDLARAVFMVLGVFLHSAVVFQVGGGWLVHYDQSHVFFNYFAEFIHDFRMYAFYLLAGFFFVLIVDKYGEIKALKTRVIRLGIPMIVVGLTFNCMANHLLEESCSGQKLEYYLSGEWIEHLWFIGNLIVYNIVTIGIVRYFTGTKGRKVDKRLFLGGIFVLVPLVSIGLTAVGLKVIQGHFLFVSFHKLYLYFPYYILGMFLYRYRHHFENLIGMKTAFMLFTLYFAIKTVMTDIALHPIVENVLLQAGTTFLVFAVIGFFNQVARGSKRLDHYVESSYTVYLLHQPLIVFAFPVIYWLHLPPWASFILLSTSVFFVTDFIHHNVIRPNKVLYFLFNGIMKKSTARAQPIIT